MKHVLSGLVMSVLLLACKETPAVEPARLRDTTFVRKPQLQPEHAHRPGNAVAQARELRYLYFANGGIIGYFSDGTVTGFPRCYLCRGNILAMFKKPPHGRYSVSDDGGLVVDGERRSIPDNDSSAAGDGWALIDYRWLILPQSCE